MVARWPRKSAVGGRLDRATQHLMTLRRNSNFRPDGRSHRNPARRAPKSEPVAMDTAGSGTTSCHRDATRKPTYLVRALQLAGREGSDLGGTV